MTRALLLSLTCVLCTACATPGWLDRWRPGPVTPERPVPGGAVPGSAVAPSSTGRDAARSRYEEALAVSTQTQQLVGGWSGADADLGTARAALDEGAWDRALTAAGEALAAADQRISDHYARIANEELARSYAYSGLDDGQLLQLRAAEEILVTGNSRLAYGRLRTLNQQLDQRLKTYTVRSGDSLWVIAGRPEVYANSLLWPLVWQANAALIPDPDRLRRGQVLKVRPHPSADEVAEAVRVARSGRRELPGVTPVIGEIREAGPDTAPSP